MSTGMECAFIEREPGQWYFLLEGVSGPALKNAWDWRDSAAAYGPFDSFEKAHEVLGREFANPGGFWKIDYDPDRQSDEVEDRLIANATIPRPNYGLGGRGWI